MWTESLWKSLRFRNAVTLLNAIGCEVKLFGNVIRLSSSRAGRQWECGDPSSFYSACSYHSWEKWGDVPENVPAADGGRAWTFWVPWDPALRLAFKGLYEKGFAFFVAGDQVSYIDRRGVHRTFHDRSG